MEILSPLSPISISASSCLDDDEEVHGANFLMNAASTVAGADEDGSCWRSRGGEDSAYLTLHFSTLVNVIAVEISFAVGFAARSMHVSGYAAATMNDDDCGDNMVGWDSITMIDDIDTDAHGTQRFLLKKSTVDGSGGFSALRFHFTKPTDLFGRLIVYRIAALG
jgi:hypothetical protein